LNRLQLFKEMYEMSTQNLICYSKDYLMTKPQPRFIKEWKREHEKVELLKVIIAEEKQKGENNMSFTQEQILRMYPKVQYYVRNSNGGLLAGTVELADAKKYAEQYKNEYINDPLNNHLGVSVYDKQGKNIYNARGSKNKAKDEETEEFE
jgi:hypothetical protein